MENNYNTNDLSEEEQKIINKIKKDIEKGKKNVVYFLVNYCYHN